ncbi:phosphinothricin acetyltransferase [Sporobacter termitidis DSM 10068]|uniref:Phosphinothricin acetyltransferase n=1 Tax=Sporobacter termitidis DSM 10068 TaxID=1123282 RepID=A0A1M5YCH6_9FIRM|nr:GNAT family N-acetyltransferase [Sporobacter termitidis]SHI09666.1 phosphinothricin acetyltransferase [Sporobacter termitidis DSM 10068]
MQNVAIEEIREEHLKDVLDIYNYYVLNSTATWHYHPLEPAEMRPLVFSGDRRYRTYVIKTDGELCGYVSVRQFKAREAYGDTAEIGIYLKNGCRGRGIGGMALKHIERFSAEQGFHVLLASISGDNEDSVRLFEKNGYEKCAHLREVGTKFGKILDNVIYQKILG